MMIKLLNAHVAQSAMLTSCRFSKFTGRTFLVFLEYDTIELISLVGLFMVLLFYNTRVAPTAYKEGNVTKYHDSTSDIFMVIRNISIWYLFESYHNVNVKSSYSEY